MAAIGIPRGRSAEFYRAFLAGIVAIITTLWAATFAIAGLYGWPFWLLSGVAVLAIAMSSAPRDIVAAIFGFVAIRFTVASVLQVSPLAFVIALVFALAAFTLLGRRPKSS